MVTIKKKKIIKDIDPKYNFLRQIRKNPKKVEIPDLVTDKVLFHASIYKAAWASDQNPGVIGMYNGKYGGTGMQSKY